MVHIHTMFMQKIKSTEMDLVLNGPELTTQKLLRSRHMYRLPNFAIWDKYQVPEFWYFSWY